MRVRLGTDADIPSIMDIVQRAIPIMHAVGNYQWDGVTYPLNEHFHADVLKSQLWVAESDDGIVAGFAALTKDQSDEYADAGCDLSMPAIVPHRMAVDVSFRRQGVALLLFDKAEELARDNGYTLVRVDTNSGNSSMNKLILKADYRFMGEINLDGLGDMKFNCYEKVVGWDRYL